ncbi:hypothetical protein GGX14DRAFT_581473 [Mycena pura]|uniref:Uncharacterized protein n=1 Tax=Mycena pura TaxID=153505 RepID=A0AAD6YV08_9AGAR|nr:hypothetical protein GGX14DRAFT_581473 [Mycena pura]
MSSSVSTRLGVSSSVSQRMSSSVSKRMSSSSVRPPSSSPSPVLLSSHSSSEANTLVLSLTHFVSTAIATSTAAASTVVSTLSSSASSTGPATLGSSSPNSGSGTSLSEGSSPNSGSGGTSLTGDSSPNSGTGTSGAFMHNAGGIIGVAIGGVVLLVVGGALLHLLVAHLRRKRRCSTPPDSIPWTDGPRSSHYILRRTSTPLPTDMPTPQSSVFSPSFAPLLGRTRRGSSSTCSTDSHPASVASRTVAAATPPLTSPSPARPPRPRSLPFTLPPSPLSPPPPIPTLARPSSLLNSRLHSDSPPSPGPPWLTPSAGNSPINSASNLLKPALHEVHADADSIPYVGPPPGLLHPSLAALQTQQPFADYDYSRPIPNAGGGSKIDWRFDSRRMSLFKTISECSTLVSDGIVKNGNQVDISGTFISVPAILTDDGHE